MNTPCIIVLGLLLATVLGLYCPNTRLEYFSKYGLGKQDEFNRTFIAIAKNLTVPQVTHNVSDSAKYRIGDYNLTYRYLDTQQKANTTVRDTVFVYGGKLRLDLDFNWNRTGTVNRNGTGSAFAISNSLEFAKNIVTDPTTGNIMWNLVDHEKVIFDKNFTITKFNPNDQNDEKIVQMMLDHVENGSSFKGLFVEGVNTIMDFYLNASLHEEHFTEEKFLNYTYAHPKKGRITVTYEQTVESARVEIDGFHLLTSLTIKDFADQTCGKPVPNTVLDPKTYGGVQTFISLGFFENNIRWAIANQVFNTELDENNWETRHFQFFAGDLYDVIPALQKKYYSNTPLNGSCKASKDGFSLIKNTIDTLNVTLQFNCSIGANSSKIIDFHIDALFVVRGQPQERHLDFVVNHTEFVATYYPTGEYTVVNKELADYYVNSSSWAMLNTKVFGSNFSIVNRDYPHFEVSKDGYVIIYDSSSIGGEQTLVEETLIEETLVEEKVS